MRFAVLFVIAVAVFTECVQASTLWRWSYHGEGVDASGAFTTGDAPDADGFYEITEISGEEDGVPITSLTRAGAFIPGNEGYPVDNLVKVSVPQLTKHGFGFGLADGTYANPFYGAHFSVPGSYVFISDPQSGKSKEPKIVFTAVIAP